MKPLILAACALALAAPAAAQNWTKGTPITVTMGNRAFTPARLTLRNGAQYILRLRNPSDRTHTFTAKSFFKVARVSPADQAWVSTNEVELKPGQSATLHLIAPDTPGAVYEFRSTRIGDAGERMKGEIYVR